MSFKLHLSNKDYDMDEKQEKKKNTEQKIAEAAMNNPDVQRIYISGFITGVSRSDIFLVLQAGITVGLLHMSYTTAKTLGNSLLEAVGIVERGTGQTILTIQEMNKVDLSMKAEDESHDRGTSVT